MKKKSTRSGADEAIPVRTRRRRPVDEVLREFETKDLGDDIRASGSMVMVTPKTVPTSIFIERDLMEQLKKKAAQKGLGYQTLMKMIVRDHIKKY